MAEKDPAQSSPAPANLAHPGQYQGILEEYINLQPELERDPFTALQGVLHEGAPYFRDVLAMDQADPQAVLAGRIDQPTAEVVQETERYYFGKTVDFIVDEHFGGDRSAFQAEELKPQDYGKLVDTLGKQLVTGRQGIGFGEAEHDQEVQDFLEHMGALSTLAIASGSPVTAEKAAHYVGQAIVPKTSVAMKAVQDPQRLAEASQVLSNSSMLLADFEAHYRDVYTDKEWQGIAKDYVAYKSVNGLLHMLAQIYPTARSKTSESLALATNTRERMNLQNQLAMIEEGSLAPQPQPVAPTVEEVLAGHDIEQLDFAVLPEGRWKEALSEVADQIAQEKSQREKTEVYADPDRLKLLVKLKEEWDANGHSSYLARGTLRSANKARKGNSAYFDEYIVLVMQENVEVDGQTHVVERVLAESPVATRNAAYVFRSDAAQPGLQDWHDVFSVPKREAQALGARPVVHKTVRNDGRTVDEAVEGRVRTLFFDRPASEFPLVAFEWANGKEYITLNRIKNIEREQKRRERLKQEAAAKAGQMATGQVVENPEQ